VSGTTGTNDVSAIVNIPYGATVNFVLVGQIRASLRGYLNNSASVSFNPSILTDTVVTNNVDSTSQALTLRSDLLVRKVSYSTTTVAGISMTYSIMVTNIGPSDAINLTVSDIWTPDPLFDNSIGNSWSCISLNPGATCNPPSFTATSLSGSNDISIPVSLLASTSVVFQLTTGVRSNATGLLINTASAGLESGALDGSLPSIDTTFTTINRAADISISKSILPSIPGYIPGLTTVTYKLSLTNLGPSDAIFVSLKDDWLNILNPSLGWSCSVISGYGQCPSVGYPSTTNISHTFNITVLSLMEVTIIGQLHSSVTSSFVNTASVSTTIDSNTANDYSAVTAPITTQADVSVDKIVSYAPQYIAGLTVVTYTITLENKGPSTAIGVSLVDNWLTTSPNQFTSLIPTNPFDWNCNFTGTVWSSCGGTQTGSSNINRAVNIDPGSKLFFYLTAGIEASAFGILNNTASLNYSMDPFSVVDHITTSVVAITSVVNVTITKDDGVAQFIPGSPVTYTVTIANGGPSDAPLTTISDILPPSVVKSARWTCSYMALGSTCPPGTTTSLTINDSILLRGYGSGSVVYQITANTWSSAVYSNLTNTASVGLINRVNDVDLTDNNSTDIDQPSPTVDLAVFVTDSQSTDTAGTTLTYSITIYNRGPSDISSFQVTIDDEIPIQFNYATWSCFALTAGAACATSSGIGSFYQTFDLPFNGSIQYRISTVIRSSATGIINNVVQLRVLPPWTELNITDNASSDFTTLITRSDISISKSATVSTVMSGTLLTYLIKVDNLGPSDVLGSNLNVTDYMPNGIVSFTWTCSTYFATCGSQASNVALFDSPDIIAGVQCSLFF